VDQPGFGHRRTAALPADLDTLTAVLQQLPGPPVVVAGHSTGAQWRGGRRFARYLRSALADRPEDRISSVAVPVLVARGRHDHYSSTRWVQALADAAPRGRVRILPSAHALRTRTCPASRRDTGTGAHPLREIAMRRGIAGLMADQTQVYHPGQIVPTSGIYRCAGGDGDHVLESTDVKGHRFPPVPTGCTGGGWVLERAAGQR